MSIIHKAFKGASWLALFRVISQSFSWAATIIIARILVPEDYGLMAMATILTGYAVIFSELGLGAAIIQRERVTDEELSSLFWFVVCWGFVLGLSCIILAYPTVAIFNEVRIFRVTQVASLLYIIGSLLIVPRNILDRELRFKSIGFIDAAAIIISCTLMIVIAKLGGGVWTLIGGLIIKGFISVILIFSIVSWKPTFHFSFFEIKPFLKFGLNLAGAGTLRYIYMNSDRFFAGRRLGSTILGYYSFALQLSSIPTEKIISFINRVSFPVFSRYQKQNEQFNNFFLNLVRLIAFIGFPIYVGAFFIADQLIPMVLGSTWIPIIVPFKLLCISQLISSITFTNAIVLNAKGFPHWNLYLTIANVLVLPVSFYIAAKYGLVYLVIPWLTIEPLIRLGHTWATLKLLNISIPAYLKSFRHPVFGTVIMLFILIIIKHLYFNLTNLLSDDLNVYLIMIVITGAVTYGAYAMVFQRGLITTMVNLMKPDSVNMN